MDVNLWSSVEQVAESAVRAAVIYVVALVAVRVAGRRTLAHMSAFDIVVSIALGTLVASTSLPSNPAVVDGVTILLTVLALQVSVAALRQRFPAVQRVTDFQPYVVMRGGVAQVRRSPFTAQLTNSDLEAQMRRLGLVRTGEAELVVLEATGKMSVLRSAGGDERAALFENFGTSDRGA